MGEIRTYEKVYKNFGKSLYITNDIVELVVPLEIGPRIIRYAFINEDKNMLFEDVDRLVKKDLSEFNEYTDNIWYLYGGHRLWISPEYMPQSYYPDNKNITYKLKKDIVKVFGPIEEFNEIQKIITIELDKNSSKVNITNEILNLSEEDKTIAPWSITTLCKDGISISPLNTKESGFIPNKIIAYWPYTKLNDERVEFIEDKFVKIKQDTNNHNAFKIGINNTAKYSLYQTMENTFIKVFEDTYTQASDYSDNGVNFEVYTKELFLELESLGKLKTISKNEKVILREQWYLEKNECSDPLENAYKILSLINDKQD